MITLMSGNHRCRIWASFQKGLHATGAILNIDLFVSPPGDFMVL